MIRIFGFGIGSPPGGTLQGVGFDLGPGPNYDLEQDRYSWRTQKGEQKKQEHHWQGSASASGQGSPHMMASRTAGTGRGQVWQCRFCIVVGDLKE